MQEKLLLDQALVSAIRGSIGGARFARYQASCNGDEIAALRLYHWNALISQAFYLPLQIWEVTLRNKLNAFLNWKFSPGWPYDARLNRTLIGAELYRLRETKTRVARKRQIDPVPTDALVADLSAGFWCGLLLKRYEIPFGWRPTANLSRIFPHASKLTRDAAHSTRDQLLSLRNRIAHHEAIYDIPLDVRWQNLQSILDAMCNGMAQYSRDECKIDDILKARP